MAAFETIYQQNESKVLKLLQNYNKTVFKSVQNISELTELPKPNESIRIITKKGVPFVGFIKWITDQEQTKHIYIATYSIGQKVLHWINENMVHLSKVTMLISGDIKSRHPETYNQIQNMLIDNYKISCKFKHSHVKVYLFKTENNHYIITGSGNANSEASIEGYIIENNKQVFDFYKQLFK